ncbi:MAG: hypothetical protein M3115_04755 [Thermoproteota archaeon]|nr:hypothetical protein [Thermoproteota archaeon]
MKTNRNQTCALCGRIIKEANIITEKIGKAYYRVDKDQCAMILKRLHSVYGDDFCMMLKE